MSRHLALLILIVVGRRASARASARRWRLAAALCVLGLENKVQAILLIGALPLLVAAVRQRCQRQRGVLAQYAIGLAAWLASRPSQPLPRHRRRGR